MNRERESTNEKLNVASKKEKEYISRVRDVSCILFSRRQGVSHPIVSQGVTQK